MKYVCSFKLYKGGYHSVAHYANAEKIKTASQRLKIS